MSHEHVWITGASRECRVSAAAEYRPDLIVDCDRRLRGPYTAAGSALRALVPRIHAVSPGLTARHAIEILAVAPELGPLIGPVPDTLTSVAGPQERTRWYSRYRTRRIAHGIVDFLAECAADRPLAVAFRAVERADPTDAEFLAVALRRLDPASFQLIVCSRGADLSPELHDALAAHGRHQVAPENEPDGAGAAGEAAGQLAAAAYVASDGTSETPGELEAYLRLAGPDRARLHDQRAAELERRDEMSLRLGAIPYHAERGSSPGAQGKAALIAAISYCVRMAFYDSALELTDRLASLVDAAGGDPVWRARADSQRADCLALLGRPAQAEPVYYDLLARSADPRSHANLWYALAMLYTRLHGTQSKDHRRARAYLNTALVIVRHLEDPVDRAFCLAFMGNARALVEMHSGD